jgi:hypothetical protein
VVVTVGEATGFEILVALKPIAGDHDQLVAPAALADNCVLPPVQMFAVVGIAVTVNELTFTITWSLTVTVWLLQLVYVA